ncbi:arf-GAP with Rho-GAP domain, ANK repeat and PH domain-containing protein 1-like isoform X3 [Mya arenaria]|uniref:arf-GAP with Rho-GAP domain, ANK repeat and PH domain-containing protein 1-like isoform X3 n=1 Tax=Mya arenaria TaxID=6604 RepID=UPI0022DEEB11|nr:arf-GAP with Rho-GAP domain, ANK repeat and PH domain-containing protein 1-like isoform X3 [Mya arenaria]
MDMADNNKDTADILPVVLNHLVDAFPEQGCGHEGYMQRLRHYREKINSFLDNREKLVEAGTNYCSQVENNTRVQAQRHPDLLSDNVLSRGNYQSTVDISDTDQQRLDVIPNSEPRRPTAHFQHNVKTNSYFYVTPGMTLLLENYLVLCDAENNQVMVMYLKDTKGESIVWTTQLTSVNEGPRGMSGLQPLQYWLESINLPQYCHHFTSNNLTTQAAILALDEARLADIGVSLPGHQQRILNHLPTPDSGIWMEDDAALPNLPPKTKSFRDSILFNDTPFQSGDSVLHISSSTSINVDTSQKSPTDSRSRSPQRISPRPVPKPRTRTTTKPKSDTDQDQLKLLARPTPAPRVRTPSQNNKSLAKEVDLFPNMHDQSTPVSAADDSAEGVNNLISGLGMYSNSKDTSSRPRTALFTEIEQSVESLSKTDKSHIVHQESLYDNMEEQETDTSTIVQNNSNKFAFTKVKPSETDEHIEAGLKILDDEQAPVVTTGSRNSKILALSLEGACVDDSTTDDSQNEDLYTMPDKSKKIGTSVNIVGHDEETSENDENLTSDDIYVNLADGDFQEPDKSRNDIAFAVDHDKKPLGQVTQGFSMDDFDPLAESTPLKPGSDRVHMTKSGGQGKVETTPSSDVQKEEASDYEPIWTNPKKDNSSWSKSVRDSNLMQFSPFKNDSSGNRTSSFDSRNSTSFNMPPPEFPPPPLPAEGENNPLTDFDPFGPSFVSSSNNLLPENTESQGGHSQSSQQLMPPIPPRPANYKAPQFETYENASFHLSGGSLTLPDSDGSMEPDLGMNTPQPIEFENGVPSSTKDPFLNADPFGEFTPDLDGLADESFPPASCQNHATNDNTFVNAFTGSGFTSRTDAIYEVAEEPSNPSNFDPFGLDHEQSETSLARSVSSTSSGSAHRLSEVVPPPKWQHTIPEGKWFQPTSTDSMYSLAANINEDDHSSEGSVDDIIDQPDGDEDNASLTSMTQAEILPTTSLSPRKKERSGYLYKQGGVKQNRGWRKRWVIFDGRSLRYYSNSKDMVSKRIVPLSCMKNVEMDIKLKDMIAAVEKANIIPVIMTPNNSRQFKFKLQCQNRTFLFATDTLDDCKMWSSTLMEAILTYQRPVEEQPGGDMANPDIADWIKINRNKFKFYVALKKHKLCYYQNMDDFKMASPLHEIDMKLSAVKETDRTRLQLNTHYSTFMLNFESSSEASNWKMAIEESITDALGDNTILDQVKENPANRNCADCGVEGAHWASMNLGVVLCMHCAGIHRGFDYRLSKIRSLRMDSKVWNSSLIELFKVIGNDNANKFWVKNLPPGSAIGHHASPEDRKHFIHNKYRDKLYCDISPLADDKLALNEALLSVAVTDDVLLTYQVLLSGAEVLYTRSDCPEMTAFELAKEAHQRLQMEFLLQNGGDRSRNFMPGSDEESSLNAKLRAEVQKQGYLMKTGSNMKDFLKRHCVLEHGHLSYYVNEDSKVEKDRIDNESMLCIQAIHHDKQVGCLEISTSKGSNNRLYLFSAPTVDERLGWMQAISQVFCPVKLMELMRQKNFSLAGYTHLKTGFNMEWQRTWYVLEKRKLIFSDKEEVERDSDSIDLRRVTSIAKITQSTESCGACMEPGSQFVLKYADRMLYFQADLTRDTDRMYTAIEHAVKHGGDDLEDQVLTADGVPVILDTCVTFIQQYGMRMDGLYRRSDTEHKIINLLQKFHDDARSVVLRIEEDTVHVVCNALKRFLRNLNDPLLTKEFYARWLQTANLKEGDHNTKMQWYKYLLQQLPRINYLALKFLVIHLYKVSQYSSENLMTIENISISMGSSLMVSMTDKDTSKSMGAGNQLQMKVLTDLITYHQWLFDVEHQGRTYTEDEDKYAKATEKLEKLQQNQKTATEDLLIHVYIRSPKGQCESVRINQSTTVGNVVSQLVAKLNPGIGNWVLHEVIKELIERPLSTNIKVWPIVMTEWQNWSQEYSSSARLCLCSTSQLKDPIEQAYDPSKPLFAELRYSTPQGKRNKFNKMAFEFTQSRLSYYTNVKNVNKPESGWNIEDLTIYKGHDPKKSPPKDFKHCFTFLVNDPGHKMGEKELFGHTVGCASEHDLYGWMGAMMSAQASCGS